MTSPPRLLAVMGATATGKTDVAEAIAAEWGAMLINADAYQVYLGLDIGTAKPTNTHLYELLDLKEVTASYSVGEFVERAHVLLDNAFSQSRDVVVVGGTGLYVRALMEEYDTMAGPPDQRLREELNEIFLTQGLDPLVQRLRDGDPVTASKVDLRNPARVKRAIERMECDHVAGKSLPAFIRAKAATCLENSKQNEHIQHRVGKMVQNGWVDEVRRFRNAGYSADAPGFRAIGYRDIWQMLDGELEQDAAIASVVLETCRYAKRQRTWLRSEPNLTFLRSETTDGRLSEIRNLF
ncbi:MAG: tRNA (adenosine(37)-N6)-dimethylallyltransferase MiaA [Fimbriimonas sp.]